jgi:hypothetical protein
MKYTTVLKNMYDLTKEISKSGKAALRCMAALWNRGI